MAKTEMCRKVTGLNVGQRTIVYYLIDDGGNRARYGVSILLEESGEERAIKRLSNDKERIEKLIDLLATNFITPGMLDDVVYKFLSSL